jgi:glycosyltransferase involved in cell wall biosynthesis
MGHIMPESSSEAASQPILSVVIIGRNEGQKLRDCLRSVRGIKNVPGPIPVVYADSNSSDGSPQAAAEEGAEVIELKAPRLTAALGRNAGWQHCHTEFVLFLDGDTILDPDFAARALTTLDTDPMIAAVSGHLRELRPQASIYNRILDLDWIAPPGDLAFCGGIALMRRAALEKVHGYDNSLTAGEEPDMCRRMRELGYRIVHIDAPMTGHDLDMTRFRQYWKRSVRTGYAYAEVASRYRHTADPFWEAEHRHNLQRGTFWIVSLAVALAASLFWMSPLPALLWLAMAAALSLRSAWSARWKSHDPWTLLLYGIHSHFQQLPIMIGQLQFERRSEKRNKRMESKADA